ncbi:unnamed protein product [Ambrosiozyma monospora]|uniref:Unnamed protein product n=1 Tax=Ambrosiozyma monospora TaxID=43982 RepID=A0ACB5T2B8_AMBMO|nr:unnamed protein product [Ambrosiozyma monospora]
MHPVISIPVDKPSIENVQQSISYLDFYPPVPERKTARIRDQSWNHTCHWFYGKEAVSISTTAHEQSITSSNDSNSVTLVNSTFISSDSDSTATDIFEDNKSFSSSISTPNSSKLVPSETHLTKTVNSTNECELVCKQGHRKCQADRLRQRVSRGWKVIKSSK